MKLLTPLLFFIFQSFLCAQTFDLYVSDAGKFNQPPWQIVKFDENGLNPEVFIDARLNWPQDILFLEDAQEVLISNLGSGEINVHDANTGDFKRVFANGISGPTRIKIGPDEKLYVLQWQGNGKVLRYDLDGSFLGEFTDTGVNQSIGLDWDATGNLYVSSYGEDYVRKFDPQGKDMGTFVSTNLAGPTNIWFDEAGDLLVLDYDGTSVKRFGATGLYQGEFLRGLSKCEGVDAFPDGKILIGNGGNASVKLFDKDGTYLKDLVASGSANLLNPNAVVLREKSPVSTGEVESEGHQTIKPTIGRTFQISAEKPYEIKEYRVYNTSGIQISSIEPAGFQIWDASDLPSGIYIIETAFKKGPPHTERVLVN